MSGVYCRRCDQFSERGSPYTLHTEWYYMPLIIGSAFAPLLGAIAFAESGIEWTGGLIAAGLLAWPVLYTTAAVIWLVARVRPWSEEYRLQRRIVAAKRTAALTEMRRKAELAEASARRTFEAYIDSEAP